MDDVFVYFVPLPNTVHELVAPCIEGYTVYINLNDDGTTQEESLQHALRHIDYKDFEGGDVQSIESHNH